MNTTKNMYFLNTGVECRRNFKWFLFKACVIFYFGFFKKVICGSHVTARKENIFELHTFQVVEEIHDSFKIIEKKGLHCTVPVIFNCLKDGVFFSLVKNKYYAHEKYKIINERIKNLKFSFPKKYCFRLRKWSLNLSQIFSKRKG